MMAAKLTGIPSIVIADYEHVRHVTHPDWIIVPEVIPTEAAGKFANRVLKYPGIKEDVYVSGFEPDRSILAELGLKDSEIIATVRPPATEAHYHNVESEPLFSAAINLLAQTSGTRIVLLPRSDRQKSEITQRWPDWLRTGKIVIPRQAVEGLNLIWHSDLVISGGGTMNREAAALGVPVYSIFRGKTGAVDKYLAEKGRLVLIETMSDIREKIGIAKRKSTTLGLSDRSALQAIVNGIVSAIM